MHTAPWANETLPEDMPPVIQVLRGDFFCAPFGASDVAADERRGHGLPANGDLETGTIERPLARRRARWHGSRSDGHEARRAPRRGSRRLSAPHDDRRKRADCRSATTRCSAPRRELQLGFSPWVMAANPPDLFETPPAGRSMLAPAQTITDLHAARLADGGVTDLTRSIRRSTATTISGCSLPTGRGILRGPRRHAPKAAGCGSD